MYISLSSECFVYDIFEDACLWRWPSEKVCSFFFCTVVLLSIFQNQNVFQWDGNVCLGPLITPVPRVIESLRTLVIVDTGCKEIVVSPSGCHTIRSHDNAGAAPSFQAQFQKLGGQLKYHVGAKVTGTHIHSHRVVFKLPPFKIHQRLEKQLRQVNYDLRST